MNWADFESEAAELAAQVKACFTRAKHATLATLRRDGAPRISGSEVEFSAGEVWLGSMPGARKALDLRRDSRFALHSPTVDPPAADPAAWEGEAKLSGRAVETTDPTATDQPHRFRLDIDEVVLTRVEGGQLAITAWHPGRGVEVHRRD